MDWKDEYLWALDDEVWKFNHYAFLSLADARRKSEMNRNPFIKDFDKDMDEFFSRVRDTEIYHFLPELKERMLTSIRRHSPLHPDDWVPTP